LIVIGEKVNATRKAVKKAILDHDPAPLGKMIREQDEAGADYIDLNAGTGSGSKDQEVEDMKWLIDLALENTEKELCIDSADPAVLASAGAHLGKRRGWMLNSVKGEEASMKEILPLAAEHGVPFVALAMDEDGIPKDAEGRLKVCGRIFEEAKALSIEPGNLFFDPLVIPVVTDTNQARVTLEAVRDIPKRFEGAKTVLGLSNISHGLPKRALVNRAFLTMAVMNGLDAAIVDPTFRGLMSALFASELLAGRDRRCRKYTRAFRKGLLD